MSAHAAALGDAGVGLGRHTACDNNMLKRYNRRHPRTVRVAAAELAPYVMFACHTLRCMMHIGCWCAFCVRFFRNNRPPFRAARLAGRFDPRNRSRPQQGALVRSPCRVVIARLIEDTLHAMPKGQTLLGFVRRRLSAAMVSVVRLASQGSTAAGCLWRTAIRTK